MEKEISSIKDLVIQALTNDSQIVYKANVGDPVGCFQMGMIHFLGINTPVNFKKASQFFSNQALADNQKAILLNGFIAECEGDFSSAFKNYAKAENSEKESYLETVIKGRNHLKKLFEKLDLPFNKEITSILNDYSKGKTSRTGASIKIAALCEDEQTCLEAAKNLFDSKSYIPAIQWLQKGGVSTTHPMYAAINEMFEKSKGDLLTSRVMEVVDLKNDSLLSNEDPTPFFNKVKKSCDDASKKSFKDWKGKVESKISAIIEKYREEEHQAYLEALAEEEARKKKRKKLIKYGAIAIGIILFLILGATESNKKENVDKSVNEEYTITGNKKLHGTVDVYPITMELQINEEKVNGSLYYDKYGPSNILILSGVVNQNELELNESERNGKPTGRFVGKYSNGIFQGEYIKVNGKSMPFEVSEQ